MITSDQIRQISDSFIEGQRLLLARRLAALRSEQDQSDIAGLLVLAGAFLCLFIGMYIVIRGARPPGDAASFALADRSHLLQSTLESLQDPIFVIDAGGTVVAWNQAFLRLAGWDPAKHATPTRISFCPTGRRRGAALLEPLEAWTPTAPERLRRNDVARAHDGRDYEVYRGEMAGGGRVIRCVDITEKLRDEMALRQGQKMEATGQLTGGMAHDFNNILQVHPRPTSICVNEIGAERPAALARVQEPPTAAADGAPGSPSSCWPSRAGSRWRPSRPMSPSLIGDLADLLRHSLGERITIELDRSPPSRGTPRIDPGQLENAILNLAINARDAMPEGGTVTVEVSNATLDRRYAALHPDVDAGSLRAGRGERHRHRHAARGGGPGIRSRSSPPRRDGKGTGLGLSMVYGFVRQSNGHIRIDSAIGQGTSVETLPAAHLDPVLDLSSDMW